MRSFEVEGRVYRSIPEFCKVHGISYQRMIRLCRKYRRAQKDPAVAARWLLGLEQLNYAQEPRTWAAQRDQELIRLRVEMCRLRSSHRKRRRVLDEFR
jgi:hypothetical protein